MLHRCSPPGVRSSPQAYRACSSPPRAAYSHSASVGSRFPDQAAYSLASFQETWTTGWSRMPFRFEPGPKGRFQVAFLTGHHHSAPWTARSICRAIAAGTNW